MGKSPPRFQTMAPLHLGTEALRPPDGESFCRIREFFGLRFPGGGASLGLLKRHFPNPASVRITRRYIFQTPASRLCDPRLRVETQMTHRCRIGLKRRFAYVAGSSRFSLLPSGLKNGKQASPTNRKFSFSPVSGIPTPPQPQIRSRIQKDENTKLDQNLHCDSSRCGRRLGVTGHRPEPHRRGG